MKLKVRKDRKTDLEDSRLQLHKSILKTDLFREGRKGQRRATTRQTRSSPNSQRVSVPAFESGRCPGYLVLQKVQHRIITSTKPSQLSKEITVTPRIISRWHESEVHSTVLLDLHNVTDRSVFSMMTLDSC